MGKVIQLELFTINESGKQKISTAFDSDRFQNANNKRNKARANAQRRKKREIKNGKNDI